MPHPSCLDCDEELDLSGVPPAPGKHRNAVSDPAETLRKELTQCQYCFKSRIAHGVTLQKCAACKVDIYCSKACQKKAWPTHKSKCKLNQRVESAGKPEQFEVLKNIRAFTSKHRPTIAEASIRALDVYRDPSRAFRDVVFIVLQPRPGITRTETSFFAITADVVPFESFGQRAEEMRGQLKLAYDSNVRAGMMGAIFAVLCHPLTGAMNICPVGWAQEQRGVLGKMCQGMPWKDWMLNRMNEGIVA